MGPEGEILLYQLPGQLVSAEPGPETKMLSPRFKREEGSRPFRPHLEVKPLPTLACSQGRKEVHPGPCTSGTPPAGEHGPVRTVELIDGQTGPSAIWEEHGEGPSTGGHADEPSPGTTGLQACPVYPLPRRPPSDRACPCLPHRTGAFLRRREPQLSADWVVPASKSHHPITPTRAGAVISRSFFPTQLEPRPTPGFTLPS